MVFSSLKVSRLTFTLRPLSHPAEWLLSPEALVMVECCKLRLLTQLELPPQEEGELPEMSLGIHDLPCLEHHLLPLCSGLQLKASPFLASLLGASSSTPHIHSLILYAVAGVFITFIVPQGHAGPLAFVLFSTTASAMAQWPFCTVFMVTSTYAVLPPQLMGPVKLNPTSLALPKGSPSLCDHCPKNRTASLWARTTALLICSSGPSWNMSAINKTLHAWEGGGWSPPPSPKFTLMSMQ